MSAEPKAAEEPKEQESSNPLAQLGQRLKKLAPQLPKVDNGLMVAGAGGKAIRLEVATRPVSLQLGGMY